MWDDWWIDLHLGHFNLFSSRFHLVVFFSLFSSLLFALFCHLDGSPLPTFLLHLSPSHCHRFPACPTPTLMGFAVTLFDVPLLSFSPFIPFSSYIAIFPLFFVCTLRLRWPQNCPPSVFLAHGAPSAPVWLALHASVARLFYQACTLIYDY